jgi:hypothetical protein
MSDYRVSAVIPKVMREFQLIVPVATRQILMQQLIQAMWLPNSRPTAKYAIP